MSGVGQRLFPVELGRDPAAEWWGQRRGLVLFLRFSLMKTYQSKKFAIKTAEDFLELSF